MKAKTQAFLIASLIFALAGTVAGGYIVYRSNNEKNKTEDSQVVSNIQNVDTPAMQKEVVASGTTIKTGESEFGSILFDGAGQAIYIWELEETTTAVCYGDCAQAWPPVLTDGNPIASGDVKSTLLGTVARTDGTTQVTYNGHPLYYYAHEKVGEVKCHNIFTHGGLWWVITSAGVRAV